MFGKKLYYKVSALIALSALIMQALLVVVSWVVTAANPELYMRSMLGGEGLRWIFGRFTENLESPLLVWIILGSIAYGVVLESGVVAAVLKGKANDYGTRMALHVVVAELGVAVCIMALLTVLPHGILLSAVGQLFPSSFSAGLFPMLSFLACVVAFTFGFMTGRFRSVTDAFSAMTEGVKMAAPLLVVYVFVAEFYNSLLFVFML